MDDDKLTPRDELLVRLMGLAPYRAITSRMQETSIDGKPHVVLPKEDFKTIIKHFLRFLQFDERSYLDSSTDVSKAIADCRYRGSPFQHFVSSGYFEGRRPVPNYLPEDHDFDAATQERPHEFFVALFRATAAYAECDYLAAERFLRTALAVCPRSYQANRLLGYILFRTARAQEAVQFLTSASEIRNDVPELCLWLSSAYQIIAMPEERAARLANSFALTLLKDANVARSYAEVLLELGHVKRAHFIYSALPIEALGGGGVAARSTVRRALDDARQQVRAFVHATRRSALSSVERIELAHALGRVGFRKLSGRLVNRVVSESRRGTTTLTSATAVRLAEAARISQGLPGATRVLRAPELSRLLDADGIAYLASLLYRSGDLQGTIELLSNSAGTKPSSELGLQYLVLALLRSGQSSAGLDTCRWWMTAYPLSTRWAGLTLLILGSRGDLPFIRVPGRNRRDEDWPGPNEQIPAQIVQFWSDAIPPADVQTAMSTWEHNNTRFRYSRFSDISAREFFASHFGPLYVEAFDACTHPAMRADYFRLGYLFKVGGIYVDADESNKLPLAGAFAEARQKSAIFVFKDRAYVPNSPLCCAPQHPLIGEALEAATHALLDAKKLPRRLDTWQALGPGLITRLVGRQLLACEASRDQFLSDTLFLREIDTSRISAEGMFQYKNSTERNWRFR